MVTEAKNTSIESGTTQIFSLRIIPTQVLHLQIFTCSIWALKNDWPQNWMSWVIGKIIAAWNTALFGQKDFQKKWRKPVYRMNFTFGLNTVSPESPDFIGAMNERYKSVKKKPTPDFCRLPRTSLRLLEIRTTSMRNKLQCPTPDNSELKRSLIHWCKFSVEVCGIFDWELSD